ncbi:MAG: hypothetical protein K0S76_1913 [Herbinix sp.]|jgi:hypothetical protein|nr:hypothetical protein [Herbinix sp.]
MEKLMEKRNLGIPVTLLTFLAFFIGYAMTVNYGTILAAVLYAFVVFSFQFDDKVKAALKQSYILSFVSILVYMGFDIFNQLVVMVSPADYTYNFLQRALNNVYKFGNAIINITVIVLFMIFMILALFRKDMKVGIISNVLGEGAPKPAPVYQQPVYQQSPYQQVPPQYNQPNPQPMPQYQQAPVQTQNLQPQNLAPAQEQAPQGVKCVNCGRINLPGAAFCATCGTKLQSN